jgi:hypothetical protein
VSKKKPRSQALLAKSADIIRVLISTPMLKAPHIVKPKATKQPRCTRAERLEAKVDRSGTGPNGCHLFTGAAWQSDGYGKLGDISPKTGRPTMRGAHVIAWEIANKRTVPEGMHVLHAQGCVNQRCVNPKHLRLGSRQENQDDAKAESRGCGRRKLSPERALKIIELRDRHGVGTIQLAKRFGVSVTAIRDVLSGRSYGHVTGRVQIPRSDSRRMARRSARSMWKMTTRDAYCPV